MTEAPNAPARDLDADAITWELQPAPLRPSDDLLTDTLVDALSYRLIVLEAFDALRQLTLKLDREREYRIHLVHELRALRARQGV